MRGKEICGEPSIQYASCPEKNTHSIDWWNIFFPEQEPQISTISQLPVGRLYIKVHETDMYNS